MVITRCISAQPPWRYHTLKKANNKRVRPEVRKRYSYPFHKGAIGVYKEQRLAVVIRKYHYCAIRQAKHVIYANPSQKNARLSRAYISRWSTAGSNFYSGLNSSHLGLFQNFYGTVNFLTTPQVVVDTTPILHIKEMGYPFPNWPYRTQKYYFPSVIPLFSARAQCRNLSMTAPHNT